MFVDDISYLDLRSAVLTKNARKVSESPKEPEIKPVQTKANTHLDTASSELILLNLTLLILVLADLSLFSPLKPVDRNAPVNTRQVRAESGSPSSSSQDSFATASSVGSNLHLPSPNTPFVPKQRRVDDLTSDASPGLSIVSATTATSAVNDDLKDKIRERVLMKVAKLEGERKGHDPKPVASEVVPSRPAQSKLNYIETASIEPPKSTKKVAWKDDSTPSKAPIPKTTDDSPASLPSTPNTDPDYDTIANQTQDILRSLDSPLKLTPIQTSEPPVSRTQPPILSSHTTATNHQILSTVLEDVLVDFRSQVRQDVQNMHLELLKQFMIQQNNIESVVERYLGPELVSLRIENEKLRREIQRLRRS